jgi:hypothetical protein
MRQFTIRIIILLQSNSGRRARGNLVGIPDK